MLTEENRTRLGQLKSRTDLSAVEVQEMQNLMQQVRGNADFYADHHDHSIIANTDAAKKRRGVVSPHNTEDFLRMVETLRREGFIVQERALS
jgi:hypothetical protein